MGKLNMVNHDRVIHFTAPCHKGGIDFICIGGELLVLMNQSSYFILGHIQLIETLTPPLNASQLAQRELYNSLFFTAISISPIEIATSPDTYYSRRCG